MNKKIFLIGFICTTLLYSCEKAAEEDVQDNNTNTTQSVVAIVGAIAGASENGIIAFSESSSFIDSIQPTDVSPFAACTYSAYSCIGAAKSLDWNNCNVGTSTLSGGWNETYSSAGCCTTFGNGCSQTRTAYAAGGSVVTRTTGATLTTTSETHTAYDNTPIAGNSGITTVLAGGTRTVNINGLHRILRGSGGTKFFDHSIKTSTPITLTGSRQTINRVVTAGVVDVYHNLDNYKAVHTFSGGTPVTWALANCCHPTSGVITTVFSGAKTGTTTLTFSGTCGVATFVDTDSSSTSITLNQCE